MEDGILNRQDLMLFQFNLNIDLEEMNGVLIILLILASTFNLPFFHLHDTDMSGGGRKEKSTSFLVFAVIMFVEIRKKKSYRERNCKALWMLEIMRRRKNEIN